jgi:hypothetical protein
MKETKLAIARNDRFAGFGSDQHFEYIKGSPREWHTVLAATFHARCRSNPELSGKVDFMPMRDKEFAGAGPCENQKLKGHCGDVWPVTKAPEKGWNVE